MRKRGFDLCVTDRSRFAAPHCGSEGFPVQGELHLDVPLTRIGLGQPSQPVPVAPFQKADSARIYGVQDLLFSFSGGKGTNIIDHMPAIGLAEFMLEGGHGAFTFCDVFEHLLIRHLFHLGFVGEIAGPGVEPLACRPIAHPLLTVTHLTVLLICHLSLGNGICRGFYGILSCSEAQN